MTNIKDILTWRGDARIYVTMTVDDFQELIKQIVKETIEAMKGVSEDEIVWLTPTQVCERLGKDRGTLWRWDKEGYLKGHKFGNRVRYKLSDVERIEVAEK